MKNFSLIAKNPSFATLLFLPLMVSAQVKMERPPSLEEYLAFENNIDTPPAVDAPKMELGLKGMYDDRPERRSSASVAEEVRTKQGHLTSLYKTSRIKGVAVERYFGVSITIGPEGDVQKVVSQGLSDKEFKAKLESAILSWSFSRVKEKKPMQVNLKNLDFLYRKELLLD